MSREEMTLERFRVRLAALLDASADLSPSDRLDELFKAMDRLRAEIVRATLNKIGALAKVERRQGERTSGHDGPKSRP